MMLSSYFYYLWVVQLLWLWPSCAQPSPSLSAAAEGRYIQLNASRQFSETDLQPLYDSLFPTNLQDDFLAEGRRQLQVKKKAYNASDPVPCVICRSLSYCSILNGYMVEETYYPDNLNYRETCKVIESFGDRIQKLVFGTGTTFRDTPQCRTMVMQYLCLFYGTNNEMYTNYCVYQETTDPVSSIKTVTQRPPCHSFCVQVAMYCANDPDFFIQTCSRIACPYPSSETCTADPIMQGLTLGANLDCEVPYYTSPYFRAAASSSKGAVYWTSWAVMLLLVALLWTH
eukprot:gene2272-2487_t